MFNGNGDTLNTPESSSVLLASSSLYTCGWYYSKMMEQHQQSNILNSGISASEHVSKKLRISSQTNAANSNDLHGTYENDEMSKISNISS